MEVMVLKSVISDDLYRSHVTGDMEVMEWRLEIMVLKSVISDDLYRSCDWRHGGHGFKVYDIR